ncbi:MAG: glycosyltransferase family 39 protein, partial [Myxococcota bacterium]
MTAAGWWRRHGLALRAIGLGALAVVAFVPGLTSPFILLDDPLYVLKNERLHATGWAGFANLWSSADAYRGAFIEFFPLRDSLYWVLFHAFGPVSFPFHLTSLAFHVCATVLVWRLARRLVVDEAVAFLAAALFAVHPIHVESVTWVAGLKDPLHVSLMLAACLTFLGWREESRPWRYGASLVFLVLALLAKSMAVVTPVLLLALDRLHGPPRPWKESLRAVAAPAAVAGLFFIQFLLIARAAGVVMPPHGGSWLSHATLAVWAQVLYLGQMLAPVSSRLIYCFTPATGFLDVRLWAGLALVAGGLVAWWRLRRQPLW